ncbi:hypothetical protein [Saccharothrix xinjiangensis]|uniref:Uncharacterized protein n=1 Tax=Saccharothrix xinjiangensis TaxID=204798 RepID=A0ABV9XXU8_9PSEU
MARVPLPDPRPDIDPAQVGASVGITAATGADYRFTDAYGVTYTGTAAHLALSALARCDLTSGIYPDQPAVAVGIRAAARTLIDWITSPHTDPEHAAEFAALSPLRVCELVVYLCLHGDADVLCQVGPASLRHYTDHLLHDPVPNAEHPLPRLVDGPHRSLHGPGARPGTRLQVTATAGDEADEVAVPMRIHASEDVHWRFTAAIPVPADRLNELLLNPDYLTGGYLSDNRELIDDYLACVAGDTSEGLHVIGRLADPTAVVLDTAPARPTRVNLFFIGPDRDTALETAPFGSRGLAERFAEAGDRIFSVGIEVDPDTVRALP